MGETSSYTECELKHIGEGYDPPEAGELCADEEGPRAGGETEESGEDRCGCCSC